MASASATRPSLTARRNPRLSATDSYPVDILIDRRRMGQTSLPGKSNAKSNAPRFDYVHLRAPLPPGLDGTEVHARIKDVYPDYYFLMRRSEDGFISATGMFKAAFPWATIEEEHAERAYLRSQGKAIARELAGNIWVHPTTALTLAEEYGMVKWIVALLSNDPVTRSTRDLANQIVSPPSVDIPTRYLELAQNEPVSASTTPKNKASKRTTNQDFSPAAAAQDSTPSSTPGKQINPRSHKRNLTGELPTPAVSYDTAGDEASDAEGASDVSGDEEPGSEGSQQDDEADDQREDEAEEELEEEYSGEEDITQEQTEVASDEENSDDQQAEPEERAVDDDDDDDDVLFAGKPASAEEVQKMMQEARDMTARAREHDRNAQKDVESKPAKEKRRADEDPEGAPALHDVANSADPSRTYNMLKKFRLIIPIDPNETVEAKVQRGAVKKRAIFGLAATLVLGVVLPYIS